MAAYCESIRDMMKSQYPAACEVWKAAPKGTISFLKSKGILKAQELQRSLEMPYSQGTDKKGWKEYKTAICDYLTMVCDSDLRLRSLMRDLANEIWEKQYTRFPKMPSPGSKQSGWIQINKKEMYTEGDWMIFWWAAGFITVTEERPSSSAFRARFNGDPTLQVLMVDHKRFAMFNALCAKDKQDAIGRVSKAVAAFTWDSL
mmetsp:Transcript_57274/g.91195  ORF Transcript_57274/g.91195 Transcript_57274/m.91195 type:complete len:202 (-) Transcript_57274:91-696(-)|eukprot:CAMPEP_0197054984 /NCGR_PEP_ID=MMETSP1384-20130603/54172_1 /TAXON_ID=29189 /ORGANISM="Ammonia sp." /LENGTH=201 /DNA_ID=CAMNT_0042488371 /DNA_START=47 /DNA_END=652 /DNA_ORIENTATION=-